MTTDAQIAANRLNAQKSTGPRTDAGKHISRWNALQTGTFASAILIPGDDPEELASLSAEYYDQKSPQTAEERFHVDTMIRCEWMIRRLTVAEMDLWEGGDAELQKTNAFNCHGNVYKLQERRLTRLTRQIAQLHRMYRESAAALAKVAPVVLRPASAAQSAHAETNPIPVAPAISLPANCCEAALPELDETNPISLTTPLPSTTTPFQFPPPKHAAQPEPGSRAS